MPNPSHEAELVDELAQLEEKVRVIEAEYAGALADPGMIQEDRDTVRIVLESARSAAEEARLALKRARSGEYGVCRACGKPIGAERLEALPDATTCIECQERLG